MNPKAEDDDENEHEENENKIFLSARAFAHPGSACYLVVIDNRSENVFTSHPASGRGVRGVAVAGTLTIQGETGEKVLRSAGLTNSSGYTGLDFELPRNLEDPDATVSVKAQLGGIVKELSEDIEFQDRSVILLTVDKPLYQPGQALRVRVLAFDASRKALAQAPLTLTVQDPENTRVYRTELVTSRFGEANAEWLIPENARLGNYGVEIRRENSSGAWAQSIKVSRYDLPNFTLSVKPDRPYHLAGENAEVLLRADYLFGQPLKRGHVRVVRETQRHWNYREQRYETREGQTVEGELDAQGHFRAKIDLASEHEKLADNDYQRYATMRAPAGLSVILRPSRGNSWTQAMISEQSSKESSPRPAAHRRDHRCRQRSVRCGDS